MPVFLCPETMRKQIKKWSSKCKLPQSKKTRVKCIRSVLLRSPLLLLLPFALAKHFLFLMVFSFRKMFRAVSVYWGIERSKGFPYFNARKTPKFSFPSWCWNVVNPIEIDWTSCSRRAKKAEMNGMTRYEEMQRVEARRRLWPCKRKF